MAVMGSTRSGGLPAACWDGMMEFLSTLLNSDGILVGPVTPSVRSLSRLTDLAPLHWDRQNVGDYDQEARSRITAPSRDDGLHPRGD